MAYSRRLVLSALFVALTALTAAIVSGVVGAVFFAITVAYVSVPYYDWLRRRGLSQWTAGAAATATVIVGVAVVFLPIVVVLYVRRGQLLALVDSFPERFVVELLGFVYAVDLNEFVAPARTYVTRTAIGAARATPIVAAKAVVFVFVVFGLLVRRDRLRTLLDPLPPEYHDVVVALHERVRETLYALYVIQAATALATFLVAVPLFALLGYRYPITLAVSAGVLQFLPVIGPSVVVLGLAAYEVGVGDPTGAALVAVLGLVVVAFLPDAVLRPRLASETARLPASLYFVGFTGGVFSLGPVGIIAGPLVIALLIESFSLLADEAATPPDPPEE